MLLLLLLRLLVVVEVVLCSYNWRLFDGWTGRSRETPGGNGKTAVEFVRMYVHTYMP